MTKKELTTQEKIKQSRRIMIVNIAGSIYSIISIILSGYLLSEGLAYDGIFEIFAGLIFLIGNASVLCGLIFFTLLGAEIYKEAKKELIKEKKDEEY